VTASGAAGSDNVRRYRSPLATDANAGRVALITGGGTGIGRATALEFARTGASVAICGRREGPLQETEAAIVAAGGGCFAMPTDIRDPDETERLVEGTLERFGSIDALVHCAGGQFMAAADDISTNGWRAVHRLTVEAAWNVTHSVARRSMIPNHSGVVVFVGFSPRRGIPGFAHASAARAALENLASGLALEWSRFGIRSLCVSAGTIRTEGLDAYGRERVEAWERGVPLGRLGSPEEVGALIAFLASPGAGYLTGTTVVIDGGSDAWGTAEPPPPPEPGST
jgi:citronellol/citronellal dehydrogenase